MIETIFGLFGAFGILIPIIIGLAIVLYLVPIPLWIAAWASGAYVGLFTLVAMRLRRVPPATIITARISAVKAGLTIPLDDLEAHFLAGGDVVRVVNAMISADKANIPLTFKRAAAIDLAGRDVLEAVQMSVLPKVIETPRIIAVARDGIQLVCLARVTVRTNIDRLVGGSGEETIIARVGEGMVSTIGSADNHKSVLENPDNISKHILAKGLDAGTAFEILPLISPMLMSARTSVRSCKSTRPTPTNKSPKPRPKSAAPWPLLKSRKCKPKWWKLKPRCHWPWQKPSVAASWASWTTTACKTCKPIPACARTLLARMTPRLTPCPTHKH